MLGGCRSLERALDRRLYLLIRGFPYGGSKDTPVWHFPEKEYGKEESLRKVKRSSYSTGFLLAENPVFYLINQAINKVSMQKALI